MGSNFLRHGYFTDNFRRSFILAAGNTANAFPCASTEVERNPITVFYPRLVFARSFDHGLLGSGRTELANVSRLPLARFDCAVVVVETRQRGSLAFANIAARVAFPIRRPILATNASIPHYRRPATNEVPAPLRAMEWTKDASGMFYGPAFSVCSLGYGKRCPRDPRFRSYNVSGTHKLLGFLFFSSLDGYF